MQTSFSTQRHRENALCTTIMHAFDVWSSASACIPSINKGMAHMFNLEIAYYMKTSLYIMWCSWNDIWLYNVLERWFIVFVKLTIPQCHFDPVLHIQPSYFTWPTVKPNIKPWRVVFLPQLSCFHHWNCDVILNVVNLSYNPSHTSWQSKLLSCGTSRLGRNPQTRCPCFPLSLAYLTTSSCHMILCCMWSCLS